MGKKKNNQIQVELSKFQAHQRAPKTVAKGPQHLTFPYLRYLLNETHESQYRYRLPPRDSVYFMAKPPQQTSPDAIFADESIKYLKTLNYGFKSISASKMPTLSSRCLVKIAETLPYYDDECLPLLLNSLTINDAEAFMYECAQYGTLTPQNCDYFASFFLTKVILPHNATDKDLLSYLEHLADNQSPSFEFVDSWEEIDLDSLTILDRRKSVINLSLLNSNFHLDNLKMLGESATSLESLHLINTNFIPNVTDIDEGKGLQICYITLISILHFFPRLTELDLVNCRWLKFEEFSEFLQYFEELSQLKDTRTAQSLTIRLIGFEGYLQHLGPETKTFSQWTDFVEQFHSLSPNVHISLQF